MRVDLRDKIIARELFWYGVYELEIQKLWALLDLRGGVVLDIGANIGLHTVALSEMVGPEGRVIAFEPDSANYRLLRENLDHNDCRNVDARLMAMGDQVGTCSISRNESNYGDHRVADNGAGDVPMTTLDEVAEQLPEGAVRLVKIDVQGHELHVIRAMERLLDRNPALVLTIEIFPDGLREAGTSASELVGAVCLPSRALRLGLARPARAPGLRAVGLRSDQVGHRGRPHPGPRLLGARRGRREVLRHGLAPDGREALSLGIRQQRTGLSDGCGVGPFRG